MSRQTVRAAVQAWLAPPNVAGLNTVHRARPKLIPGTDYQMDAGPGYGAVGVIHLPDDDRVRDAVAGAHSGEKTVTHQIALEILFQSVLLDAESGFDAHDALLDAIYTRLEADRTLGTAGTPIWQAGEGTFGIKTRIQEPVLTPQALQIAAVVTFEAVEKVVT